MELRQIKYFIEVAKREHVTKAANALHVAQSAVSRQIFNLEAELGVDLFIREGRNVKLTAVGKIFLEHMEQAIHVIDDAKQVVMNIQIQNVERSILAFQVAWQIIFYQRLLMLLKKNFPM